jgi:hypothetical protein
MKTLAIVLATLTALVLHTSAAQAQTDMNQMVAQCRDLSGLPSGLSVQIVKGGLGGFMYAKISNRDNIGPFENLGRVLVTRKVQPSDRMGAPTEFVGKDFDLVIVTDALATNGMFPAHVSVEIRNRVFNQQMKCSL